MKTSFLITLVLGGFLAFAGCSNHKLEKDFFFGAPAATRMDRLRQYSLEDQYRLYRYGSDKFHPPLIGLAKPIAERGCGATPFLLEKLNPPVDDIAVRDVLHIFATMSTINSCDVKSNLPVMDVLRRRVEAMRDGDWKKVCEEMIKRIESAEG